MFSMSEVALMANIKHQERLQEALGDKGIPVAPRDARRVRLAQAIRALAARLDPVQGDVAQAGARLTPAK